MNAKAFSFIHCGKVRRDGEKYTECMQVVHPAQSLSKEISPAFLVIVGYVFDSLCVWPPACATQINLHLVISLERDLKSEDSPYYP